MDQWHKEARRKWDGNAAHWSANSQDMWENGSRKTIIPFFCEHIPKGSAADLGCGDGFGSLKLAQAGWDVTGVDFSSNMIQEAGEKTKGFSNLAFIEGDLTSLPFENATFDSLLAVNSLEWTASPLQALKEAKRILKPSGHGCFCILGPAAGPRANAYPRLYGKDVIMNTMQIWEFEKLAAENGWTLLAEHGVPKNGVSLETFTGLARELKQALSFMWVFIFQKG